jgi:hypothetical protein
MHYLVEKTFLPIMTRACGSCHFVARLLFACRNLALPALPALPALRLFAATLFQIFAQFFR